jgi:PAS domain-containing protein
MPNKESKRKLDERTYALAVMRATLEATADGILSADEAGWITGWNAKFLEMWRVPEELAARRDIRKIQAFIAQRSKDPEGYLTRIAEIGASKGKSFDLLELTDGELIERYSEVISVEEKSPVGCGVFAT